MHDPTMPADTAPARSPQEAARIAGLASGVREEYARPWHDLTALELADCFITAMRNDGWLSRFEVTAREAAAWAAGAEAMREMAVSDARVTSACAAAIRALTAKETPDAR